MIVTIQPIGVFPRKSSLQSTIILIASNVQGTAAFSQPLSIPVWTQSKPSLMSDKGHSRSSGIGINLRMISMAHFSTSSSRFLKQGSQISSIVMSGVVLRGNTAPPPSPPPPPPPPPPGVPPPPGQSTPVCRTEDTHLY